MAGAVISGTNTASLHNVGGGKQYAGKDFTRHWLNTASGEYDGLLPKTNGTSEDHYVCKNITGTPVFTNLQMENRSSGRPDVYWDDPAKILYCLGPHNSTVRFWSAFYDDQTGDYSPLVGTAGAGGITVPGLSRSTYDMTLSLTKSPNGYLWAFELDGTGLKVQRSTNGGATWLADRVKIADNNGHGSVSSCWFTHNGTNYVCVFCAEDGAVGGATQYFYVIDEDADITNLTNWINESDDIPALDAGVVADNHVTMARSSDHTLYIGYKDDADAIKLVTRTAAGTWAGSYEAWAPADNKTRPALLVKKIDSSTDEELMIVVNTTSDGPTVVYKTSPLDTILFSSEVVLFEDTAGSDVFNDSMTHQGDFIASSDSGVVVIAENVTDTEMWVNTISIAPPVNSSIPLVGAAITLATAAGTVAASIPIEGAAATVSSASGGLSVAVNINGAAVAEAIGAAAMTSDMGVSGAAVAAAIASGGLSINLGLEGNAVAAASATADLSSSDAASVPLSGDATASASASASSSMDIPISGAAISTSGAAGGLGAIFPVSGSAASVTAAVGALNIGFNLAANASADALAGGDIKISFDIDGAAVARASASGALSLGGTHHLPPPERLEIIYYEERMETIPYEHRITAA